MTIPVLNPIRWLVFFCLVVGGVQTAFAQQACPTTRAIASDPIAAERLGIGPLDALAFAIAELNGTLSSTDIPELTFEYGRDSLSVPLRNCLKSFGTLVMRAESLGPIGLEIVGHADSVGSDANNLSLSLQRARWARTYLRNTTQNLSSRVPISVIGRGESEPWPCGPVDGQEDAAAPGPCTESAFILRVGVKEQSFERVRNDRRLEIRVTTPLVAGPRYEALSVFMELSQEFEVDYSDSVLATHLGVLRHYPAGTSPLHPVVVPLNEPDRAITKACVISSDLNGGRSWIDTGWREATIAPGLFMRPTNGNPTAGRDLLVRVRARPNVERFGEVNDPPGIVELMLATTVVHEGDNGRPDAAIGTPDPWRVRIQLPQILEDLKRGSDGVVLTDCLGAAGDELSNDQYITDLALTRLPRDASGLLAQAHQFNEATGMFALQPGATLRLIVGEDTFGNLFSPSGNVDFPLITSELMLPLYPARTARPIGAAADPSVPLRPVSAAALDAVTLDPGFALRWSERTTMSEISNVSNDKTYGIGDLSALELFMRGRIVYVFPPRGEGTPSTRELPRGSDSSKVVQTRDTLLVATSSLRALDNFLEQPTRSLNLQLFGDKNLSACAQDFGDEPTGSGISAILCGRFAQPVSASLLFEVTANGVTRQVPLGATLSTLLPRSVVEDCFDTLAAATAEIEPRFLASSYLNQSIRIPLYGVDEATYDGRDCRLIGLPLISGASFSWNN